MRRAIPLIAVLALMAACSGNGEDSSATSASTTTTTQLSPEEAFRSELEAQLDAEPGFFDDALDLARNACDIVGDFPTLIEEDDAPNDTPESDAAIADVSVTMGLAFTVRGFDDDVASILMTATSNHICPEHADTINDFMAGRTR